MHGLGLPFTQLATSYATRLRQIRRRLAYPATVWGDSLAAGAGASNAAHRFPAAASSLYQPVRDIANLGQGGLTSTQIAARQGGVPINVTLNGNSIPAWQAWSWNFTGGLAGWVPRTATSPYAVIAANGGYLDIVSIGTSNSGAQVWLGDTIPAGATFTLDFDLVSQGTGFLHVGLVAQATQGTATGSWTSETVFNGATSQHKTITAVNGATAATALLFMTHTAVGTFRFTNVTLKVGSAPAVAVSAKSVNPLFESGVYTGSLAGTIGGIPATLTTDASGNWTLTRTTAGAAVSIPAGTAFVPSLATQNRSRTAWIWAGRNNYTAPATVQADIAAMIASLGHRRYLVGAILPSAADTAAAVTAIAALNATLRQTYGTRFVDLLPRLQKAGNGSSTDQQDIAAGLVPGSLRSDNIHLNDAGYAIVAKAFRDRQV